ncbi:transposase [Marinilabilia salmonicolor]|uniref:transposase n=1 Tax=Marinilabilia salmonicolor TaxID=989 RepID=UPI00029AEF83|nr:transposase [Marinilabilia salmonicolor]
MDTFQNKYRIPSARMQNWDYGWNAAYFVAICTANRDLFFGDIVHGKMRLSEIGEMVHKYWFEISEHFPFVKLDVHIVMPNHVHGIVLIDKPDDGRNDERNGGRNDERVVGRNVEMQNFASLQPPSPPKNKFGFQSQNLAFIIRDYKTGVTKYARNNNVHFAWQSRFHDHIIRNDAEYQRIKNYIIRNPTKWHDDSLNT